MILQFSHSLRNVWYISVFNNKLLANVQKQILSFEMVTIPSESVKLKQLYLVLVQKSYYCNFKYISSNFYLSITILKYC